MLCLPSCINRWRSGSPALPRLWRSCDCQCYESEYKEPQYLDVVQPTPPKHSSTTFYLASHPSAASYARHDCPHFYFSAPSLRRSATLASSWTRSSFVLLAFTRSVVLGTINSVMFIWLALSLPPSSLPTLHCFPGPDLRFHCYTCPFLL